MNGSDVGIEGRLILFLREEYSTQKMACGGVH